MPLSAIASPQAHALDVLEQWSRAFAASDVEGIVGLYAPDALFIGTSSKIVVTETAGIRSYFEHALLTRRPRGASITDPAVMTLSDTTVLISALNTTTGVQDGKPFSMPGRVTFAIAKRGDDWRIVHFHRSAMPGLP
jgi:uncharacterized protein (TIGR02246 family)